MSLYGLLMCCLLVVNALSLLNEKRFLEPMGIVYGSEHQFGDNVGLKSKIATVLASFRTLPTRLSLIIVNVLIIFWLLLRG
uniref:Yos1-like protein n=1 Tax=Arcella intermedia TaxID=1963864 RepID=A0A6B2LV88_9EUKA